MPFIQTADGASLFVTEWGSGPPVVFTHAWGLRSDQWDYQVPALAAAGMRCVLYDRRGHGRSDRPAAGYDLDTMADDLAAVIDHFGLRGITLVAHSLGSKEAVRYLTRHGDSRVARLVLVAPVTPLMRRTADNPDGLDPALIDANYAAVAADVPRWCAEFEAAGPYFGASPGSSRGLIDWARPVRQRPRRAERGHPRLHPRPSPARPGAARPEPGMTSRPMCRPAPRRRRTRCRRVPGTFTRRPLPKGQSRD
jgi:pimeloyl-ACP methyl ester carboxylesterase